jgi:hypothetical protein
MLVIILLTVLALVLPLVVLRSFSFLQKVLVLAIIVAHLAMMFFLHYRLVQTRGYPIVIDIHVDTQKYYDDTSHFATWGPFGVMREAAIRAGGGSRHFGYHYVLGTLWTITPYPALGIRLLKTMLFFTSLSCLARVWRRDYGAQLAMGGFAFMGILCTPAFYYNYRNLKDGLILALFMFIMALLDTLLRPHGDQLQHRSTSKTILGWIMVLILLYALSTLRLYTSIIIVIALTMHALATTSRIKAKRRLWFLTISIIAVLVAFSTGTVADIMVEAGASRIHFGIFTPRSLLQAFLSPIPWGLIVIFEPCNVFFYSIYWLLLPYALYTLFRHLWSNIDWHLFLYIMITYVVGVVIGDPPRKRLIVYPILVMWVLAHLAYKQRVRSGQQEYAREIEEAIAYQPEYPPGRYLS